MIARIWHGAVPHEKTEDYTAYLLRTGIAEYKATPGNLGVQMLRQTEGGVTHFLLISYWESYDAIRAFAGNDITASHYYPEDAEFLIELEPTVTHYEVLDHS